MHTKQRCNHTSIAEIQHTDKTDPSIEIWVIWTPLPCLPGTKLIPLVGGGSLFEPQDSRANEGDLN